MPEERTSDGRFAESVSDDDLLFFFETGDRPFYGTGEVAEKFDLSNTHVKRRLESLSAAGELREVRLNDRHTAWWRERDTVTLRAEDGKFSAHDTTTGVASGGDTRPEALRNLAEAIEVNEGVDVDDDAFAELDGALDSGCGDGNPF